MEQFQPEHVLSYECVEDMIRQGIKVHYYWSDAVAADRNPPDDFMIAIIEKLVTTGKCLYATPATDEGERLLHRRGFVPIDAGKDRIGFNYIVDVTEDKIKRRYGKIFRLWHERCQAIILQ